MVSDLGLASIAIMAIITVAICIRVVGRWQIFPVGGGNGRAPRRGRAAAAAVAAGGGNAYQSVEDDLANSVVRAGVRHAHGSAGAEPSVSRSVLPEPSSHQRVVIFHDRPFGITLAGREVTKVARESISEKEGVQTGWTALSCITGGGQEEILKPPERGNHNEVLPKINWRTLPLPVEILFEIPDYLRPTEVVRLHHRPVHLRLSPTAVVLAPEDIPHASGSSSSFSDPRLSHHSISMERVISPSVSSRAPHAHRRSKRRGRRSRGDEPLLEAFADQIEGGGEGVGEGGGEGSAWESIPVPRGLDEVDGGEDPSLRELERVRPGWQLLTVNGEPVHKDGQLAEVLLQTCSLPVTLEFDPDLGSDAVSIPIGVDTEDDDTCVICLDAPASCFTVPCTHKCVCLECSKSFPLATGCPVCRHEIHAFMEAEESVVRR